MVNLLTAYFYWTCFKSQVMEYNAALYNIIVPCIILLCTVIFGMCRTLSLWLYFAFYTKRNSQASHTHKLTLCYEWNLIILVVAGESVLKVCWYCTPTPVGVPQMSNLYSAHPFESYVRPSTERKTLTKGISLQIKGVQFWTSCCIISWIKNLCRHRQQHTDLVKVC